MSRNGIPIQDISDTVGHRSTHVTEPVYRHVIVPAIRGGAAVMDDIFGAETTVPRRQTAPDSLARLSLGYSLFIEHRPGKPVELRGFEPLTPSMRKTYHWSCCQ